MTDLWKWMERLVFLLSGEKWWWRISSVRSSIAGWTAGDMFSQRARHRSGSLAVHLVSSDRPWLVQMFLTTFSFVAISQEEEGLCLVKVSQYYFIICSNRRGEKDVSVKDYRRDFLLRFKSFKPQNTDYYDILTYIRLFNCSRISTELLN